MKSKSKLIVRETLNYWGIFENKRLSVCIVCFYDKKSAYNYCTMINDNRKGDVLEIEELIKKASK